MAAAASAWLARKSSAAPWTRGHWPARKPGQGSRSGARRARPCFHSATRAAWSAAGAGAGLRPKGLSQSFGVYGSLSMQAAWLPPNRRQPMILNALAEKLKRRAKADFKGWHFEAPLIL